MISVESIANQIKEYDIKLLIEVELSKDEQRDLINYLRAQIQRVNRIYPDLRLALGLTIVARMIYDQGDFWGNLSEKLKVDISQSRSAIIGKIFLETLRRYNLFEIESNKKRNDYVQNILAHGFVPFKYRENFYEFLFSFYDRNLGRVISDDIDEDIEDLRNYMREIQHTNTEDLFFEDSKGHAAVSYKLIKSTQALIAQCEGNVINDQILNYLKLIDNYFYYNSTDGMENNPNLRDWCENKFEKMESRSFSRIKGIQRFRNSTPFIGYDIKNNHFYLAIPQRKFPNGTTEAIIKVLKDGEEYLNIELDLYQAFGCIKSDDISFYGFASLNDIFSEFKIYCNDKLITTIDKKSYRIFKNLNSNISELIIDYYEVNDFFEGEVCLITQSDVSIELDNSNLLYQNNLNGILTTHIFNFNPNSTVLINDIPFEVNSNVKNDSPYKFFFNSPINFNIKTEENEDIISTYKHPKIYFRDYEELLSSNAFIWCNNKKFNLRKSIEYKKISDDLEYATINLNELVDNEEGEYRVQLDIPGNSQRKTLSKYLLIDKLDFKTDQDFYVFKNKAYITKISDYYIHALNSKKIENKDNKYEYDFKDFSLSKKDDTPIVKFEIEIAEKLYIIEIPIKILKYSFDDKNWLFEKKDYIWNYQLKNFVYVVIPTIKEALLFLGNDSYFPFHSSYKNDCLRFDISKIIERMEEEEKFNDTLNIEFTTFNKIQKKEICRIINQIDIKSFKLDYDKNAQMAIIDTEFHAGKQQFGVEIQNIETEETYDIKLHEGKNYIENIDPQGIYNIIQYVEEKKSFFSSGERKEISTLEKQCFSKIFFLPKSCQIIINDLHYEGIRYPLNFKYEIAKVTAKYDYRGVLFPDRDYVVFDFVDEDNTQIYFRNFRNRDDIVEYCYDLETKKLILSDSSSLGKDYERYLFLDSENTYFNVTIKENIRKDY